MTYVYNILGLVCVILLVILTLQPMTSMAVSTFWLLAAALFFGAARSFELAYRSHIRRYPRIK